MTARTIATALSLAAAGLTATLAGCSATDADASGSETTMNDHGHSMVNEDLRAYMRDREAEFDTIPAARKRQLEELAEYVSEVRAAGKTPQLNFVCTHNSRRSHMSQLWAQAAAVAHGVPLVTFSGGTEETAFNPRAIAAIQRAGFRTDQGPQKSNPLIAVSWQPGPGNAGDTVCFSKKFDHPDNPTRDFAAVMVCNDADENCPAVPGADRRFAITYVDPKVSDGTPQEAATYDERCAQIAREMLYMVSRVRTPII